MSTGNSTSPQPSPQPKRSSKKGSLPLDYRTLPGGMIDRSQGCLLELPSGCRIVAGNLGDHSLIVPLLEQVYQSPMAEDFQSRTDEPNYAPSDRLLIKRHQEIVGHLQVSRHIGWFQGHRIPLVKLQDLVVLPEYDPFRIDRPAAPTGSRHKDSVYSTQLLNVAEAMAAREGAILGLVHTDLPGWFDRHGWSRCRGQGHTQADARAILSHLDAQQSVKEQLPDNRCETIQVRTWRHFELDCLRRIYGQVAAGMWGPLHRSEGAWQWLVGRKAQDQILLAIDPSRTESSEEAMMERPHPRGILGDRFEEDRFEEDPFEEDKPLWADEMADQEEAELGKARDEEEGSREDEETPSHFESTLCDPQSAIGYAVVRDSCIVEMFTLPGYDSARVMIIAMACREAIDRDHHFVSLHTPAVDPMHELLITAGGHWIDSRVALGGVWMFKLLSPEKWIDRLYPILHERAREAGLSRPFEVGMTTGCSDYRLTVTRRSSRLQQGKMPTRHLACDWHTLQDLLASNLTLTEASTERRMEIAGIDPCSEDPLTAWHLSFRPSCSGNPHLSY